jgi:hypothetical protein
MKDFIPEEAEVYVLINWFDFSGAHQCQIMRGKAKWQNGTKYSVEFKTQSLDRYLILNSEIMVLNGVYLSALKQSLFVGHKDGIVSDAYISLDKNELLRMFVNGLVVKDYWDELYTLNYERINANWGYTGQYGVYTDNIDLEPITVNNNGLSIEYVDVDGSMMTGTIMSGTIASTNLILHS